MCVCVSVLACMMFAIFVFGLGSKYRRLRGINRRIRPPIGKHVSVSFRVRVVRASERAMRSCVGV